MKTIHFILLLTTLFFTQLACTEQPVEQEPCEDLTSLGPRYDWTTNTQKNAPPINRKIKAGGLADPSAFLNDTDGDQLNNDQELELGTDPYWPDTDNDRLPDGYEVENGTDPPHTDEEAVAEYRQKVKSLMEEGGTNEPFMVPNSSCRMLGYNGRTCSATCTGTCLGGLSSCFWSWSPAQWGH